MIEQRSRTLRQDSKPVTESMVIEIIKKALPEYKDKKIDLKSISSNSSIESVTIAVSIEAEYNIRFTLDELSGSMFSSMEEFLKVINQKLT